LDVNLGGAEAEAKANIAGCGVYFFAFFYVLNVQQRRQLQCNKPSLLLARGTGKNIPVFCPAAGLGLNSRTGC
jgi:hypothetical protein